MIFYYVSLAKKVINLPRQKYGIVSLINTQNNSKQITHLN